MASLDDTAPFRSTNPFHEGQTLTLDELASKGFDEKIALNEGAIYGKDRHRCLIAKINDCQYTVIRIYDFNS